MLVDLSENPSYIPQLKVVFLDEAQDLTPLQWKIAHLINEKTDRMFIAGDDDQAIYGFAGSSPDWLLWLAKRWPTQILEQSWRVP